MIKYEEVMVYKVDENVYPSVQMVHELNLNCTRCGKSWTIAVPLEYVDYRKEAESWKDRYISLESQITELMRYSEIHYGVNPSKDKLVNMLNELRKKFNVEDL